MTYFQSLAPVKQEVKKPQNFLNRQNDLKNKKAYLNGHRSIVSMKGTSTSNSKANIAKEPVTNK